MALEIHRPSPVLWQREGVGWPFDSIDEPIFRCQLIVLMTTDATSWLVILDPDPTTGAQSHTILIERLK
jgi:hypothetical protein